MDKGTRIAVVSDIHYASSAERARGNDYELKGLRNPARRLFLRLYRRFLWLHEPLNQNYLLDDFLARREGTFLVVNGDLTCNTGFIGAADDAALLSARECLAKLRSSYGVEFAVVWGDHDLGKRSFSGDRGGMRLASAHRLTADLGLPAFWRYDWGRFVLAGIASSLVALKAFEIEMLPEERSEWQRVRGEHMARIRELFESLRPDQKLILFCHDPTALPFLLQEEAVRGRLNQVELTIIGHLHSELILKLSGWLAGMPELGFLGHTARKLSRALGRAREWKPFKIALCPSLAGIELLKDGGYATLCCGDGWNVAPEYRVHRLPRRRTNSDENPPTNSSPPGSWTRRQVDPE